MKIVSTKTLVEITREDVYDAINLLLVKEHQHIAITKEEFVANGFSPRTGILWEIPIEKDAQ